jgi:hypothetical protein
MHRSSERALQASLRTRGSRLANARQSLPVSPPPSASAAPAAPTATPAAATAAKATPAAPSASTLARRPSFVDHDIAAIETLTVQRLDGAVGFFVTVDFDETKAAWLSRKAVPHQCNVGWSDACLCEPAAQFLFSGLKGQVAHVELLHQIDSFFPQQMSDRGLEAEEAGSSSRAVL